MGFRMESSSSKKPDDRIPRRPGYLERGRDFQRTFRDDTFIKTSPLERQISELQSKIKANENILDQLRRDSDTLKKFPDLVRQKEDLLLIDKFDSLMRASEILDKSGEQVQIGISRSSGQQTEISESIDIKSMDDGLNKSKEILNALKARGANTQKLEDHLYSVERWFKLIETIIGLDNKNNGWTYSCQRDIDNWKESVEAYKTNIQDYKDRYRSIKNNICNGLKNDSERPKQENIFLEELHQTVQKEFPNISLGSSKVENKKINLISKEDEFYEAFNKATQYSENILSWNEELDPIAERLGKNLESWEQCEKSFHDQMNQNSEHKIFTENNTKKAVELLKERGKEPQEREIYSQEKKEIIKKYFQERAELLQERANLLQEVAEFLPQKLSSAKSIKILNKGLFAYTLKSASSDFKEFLSKLGNELENQVNSQNMKLEKISRNKKINELDQEIKGILQEVGLGSSRKSQAERIKKAKREQLLEKKQGEIEKDIQETKENITALENEIRGNIRESFKQQRYSQNAEEDILEKKRDIIYHRSKDSIERIKKYWRDAHTDNDGHSTRRVLWTLLSE